ncbi:putative quinol monooxygenase [Minwuia sp.]|uniref:putative quinol monooxygenase n=1 Tax=Minwuia sp. TaxID=2493630 RepID=UPI003A93FE64
MSVVVLLEFKCRQEAYDGLKQTMSAILPDTAKFAGCEQIHAAADDENHSIVLYEVWDAVASQQKYIGWRQETGLMETLGPALREPPAVRTMNVLSF